MTVHTLTLVSASAQHSRIPKSGSRKPKQIRTFGLFRNFRNLGLGCIRLQERVVDHSCYIHLVKTLLNLF